MLLHLTDEGLSVNAYTNVYVFGDSNVQLKDWLICFGGTDRQFEPLCNSSISNDLAQALN